MTLRHFAGSALEDTPLEGPFLRTLVTLFRAPGRLTADYIAGRRRPYLSPFRVYLLISLVFFLIQPHTGLFRYSLAEYETLPFFGDHPNTMVEHELQRTGETRASYEERFNRALAPQKKTMMVFMVPMLAFGLMPFFRRRHYSEHLVYSIHYFAALLLYMGVLLQVFFKLLIIPLRYGGQWWPAQMQSLANVLFGEGALTLTIAVPAVWYLRKAAMLTYNATARRATIAAIFVFVWQMLLLVFFYRMSLFFTTFYSLKWLS
ncbi:MAG TPA: DUF3667 domain-containing protein [Longimicrobiales bacterium]|nr:DUF3667 domain-containing protein [Longimicrobiales bacterium]